MWFSRRSSEGAISGHSVAFVSNRQKIRPDSELAFAMGNTLVCVTSHSLLSGVSTKTRPQGAICLFLTTSPDGFCADPGSSVHAIRIPCLCHGQSSSVPWLQGQWRREKFDLPGISVGFEMSFSQDVRFLPGYLWRRRGRLLGGFCAECRCRRAADDLGTTWFGLGVWKDSGNYMYLSIAFLPTQYVSSSVLTMDVSAYLAIAEPVFWRWKKLVVRSQRLRAEQAGRRLVAKRHPDVRGGIGSCRNPCA